MARVLIPPVRLGAAVVTMAVLLSCSPTMRAGSGGTTQAPTPRGRFAVAACVVPGWQTSYGETVMAARRAILNEVTSIVYWLQPDGSLRSPEDDHPFDTAAVNRLHAQGARVLAGVANLKHGNWDRATLTHVLGDPRRRSQHVTKLVELASSKNYDGIDLDYEALKGGDRSMVTAFVTELSRRLHAQGKLLSMAVPAKTSDRSGSESAMAMDYGALGHVVDALKVMAYDYHWITSGAGPIAPAWWVADVLRYATSRVAPSKVVLGFGLYGYDWVGKRAQPISWQDAQALLAENQTSAQWDERSASPWFSYRDGSGKRHTVWFEDARSFAAKLDATAQVPIGGVFLWLNPGGDPGQWAALAAAERQDSGGTSPEGERDEATSVPPASRS